MTRDQQPALFLFAVGMIGLGILGVVYRDFAYDWQPVPAFHTGRELLAVVCGLFMIAVSVSLLYPPSVTVAARALFPFLVLWQLLKVPAVLAAPRMEAVWLGFGEIAVLLAGGWVLFARLSRLDDSAFRRLAGERGARIAQYLFGLAVLPIGVSHLVYPDITASLVPSWLPFRTGFAYLTGVGQIACGLGVLFSILPRAAALIEAGMIALFALLVWGPDSWISQTPKLPGAPAGPRFALTAFFITWVIAASALLVATNIASSRRRIRESARVPDLPAETAASRGQSPSDVQ